MSNDKLTIAKFALQFVREAANARRILQREYRGNYIAAREVEIIPLDAKGERAGDPVFSKLGKLTGKELARLVPMAMAATYHNMTATSCCVEVGFDCYENFREYAHGSYDYEPRVDHYSLDLPEELL